MKQRIRTSLCAATISAQAIVSLLSPGLAFGQQASPEPIPALDTGDSRAAQAETQQEREPLPEPDRDEPQPAISAPEPDAQGPPEPLPPPDDEGGSDKES